jgi:hypothetical protein
MMKINKYINSGPKEDIFHSNGMAQVASGGNLGAASAETFERRSQINRQRSAVRHYGDSLIGRGDMKEVARPQMRDSSRLNMRSSRQGMNSARPMRPAMPSRPFREPPGRGFNPFG